MSEVIKSWNDDENFIIELTVSGFSIYYAFPIAELASGASLAKMMNLKVRETLKHNHIDPTPLRRAASKGVAALRELVEHYFKIHGEEVSP